jgi:hypothetical protein
MPDLNIRGIDDNTMQQIRMAAASRGGQRGRAGVRSWAFQILKAATREELNGRPIYPKLKLCARCVIANQAMAKAPVHACGHEAASVPRPEIATNPFAHLLGGEVSNGPEPLLDESVG